MARSTSAIRPLLLSIPDAAAALGIGRTLVNELVSMGELASIKIGGRRLVRLDAIEQYVASRTVSSRKTRAKSEQAA